MMGLHRRRLLEQKDGLAIHDGFAQEAARKTNGLDKKERLAQMEVAREKDGLEEKDRLTQEAAREKDGLDKKNGLAQDDAARE